MPVVPFLSAPRRVAVVALAAAISVLVTAVMAVPAHAQGAPADDDTSALLARVDRYRASDDALQVETLVETLDAQGAVDKERRYTVLLQPGHQSLVLMRSPADQGQKVLMLGDDYWLLMPGSQRPMRITASQKLLGDAATGDIATLSWRDDYRGRRVGEGPCDDAAPARRCLHLSLEATRKGVSYQRVELWVGAVHLEPVRADLYVQSDKLAKRARFIADLPDAPTRIDAMLLSDELAKGRQTRVRYLQRQPRRVPETWFNPMYLARNPGVE